MTTVIQVSFETREALKKAKLVRGETYDEVIRRLLAK